MPFFHLHAPHLVCLSSVAYFRLRGLRCAIRFPRRFRALNGVRMGRGWSYFVYLSRPTFLLQVACESVHCKNA